MSKYHYTYLQISVYSPYRLVSFLPALPESDRINQSPGVRHWFSLSKKRSCVMKIFLIAGAFAITTPEGWVSNHLVVDKNCLVRTNPTLLLNCSSFFVPKNGHAQPRKWKISRNMFCCGPKIARCKANKTDSSTDSLFLGFTKNWSAELICATRSFLFTKGIYSVNPPHPTMGSHHCWQKACLCIGQGIVLHKIEGDLSRSTSRLWKKRVRKWMFHDG